MLSDTQNLSISNLDYLPFLNIDGEISEDLQGKIGIYAIFDRNQVMQYVGYSRDIFLSLKQHLVRQPQNCYWLKIQTISSPNRTLLESVHDAWIIENGAIPPGNGTEEEKWTQPIDAKPKMTEDEQSTLEKGDDLIKAKLLKQVARRVEEEILAELKARGVQMEIRFNPKLKESGLLDLK